ncbi:MAG TPA: T9SS type A sorting domain-containing protein [Flavobacteriales bacterium]|nr:T9SS type A sorting domain-containing protein [Flavobacteriales bacterium]
MERTILRFALLFPIAHAGLLHAQDVADRLIYGRSTQPNGALWLNDGNGIDSLYFTNGNIPRVDQSGRFIFYMQNTAPGNEAFGGSWMRRDVADGTDHLLGNGGGDYTVGYDMLESDSSLVMSYSCAIYRKAFDGSAAGTITSASCYDDGPNLRQSDSLIVFHNTQQTLFTMHLDGSARTAVPNTISHDVWPIFSPDGQWLLFGRLNDANIAYRNYYKVKVNGDSLTKLTPYDPLDTAHFTSNAVWSSDGQAIICAGWYNGQHRLIAYSADGSFAHMALPTTPGDIISSLSGTATITVVDGIAEEGMNNALHCWPVPADDHVFVQWAGYGIAALRLYDAQGRLLTTRNVTGPMADVDVQDLRSGIYSLVITTRDGKARVTRVVKR